MECNNCGWNNPIGATKCQKCNQPLEKPVTTATTEGLPNMCPECGYLVSDNTQICPNCGTTIGNATVASSKATVIIDLDNDKPANSTQKINPKATVVLNLDEEVKPKNEAKPAPQAEKQAQAPAQKINPKATVVLNLDEEVKPKNEAKPAPQAEKQAQAPAQKINPKSTVVLNLDEEVKPKNEAKPTANDVDMYKKTVREIPFIDEKPKETGHKYQLECMDCTGKTPINITLEASEAIQLNKGDILLIAGLRYRVV